MPSQVENSKEKLTLWQIWRWFHFSNLFPIEFRPRSSKMFRKTNFHLNCLVLSRKLKDLSNHGIFIFLVCLVMTNPYLYQENLKDLSNHDIFKFMLGGKIAGFKSELPSEFNSQVCIACINLTHYNFTCFSKLTC